jgi:hypothetical protein
MNCDLTYVLITPARNEAQFIERTLKSVVPQTVVCARINPPKGSKQEGINSLKKHFGAKLVQGYMWKYALHPLKYRLYCLAARLRSGGDIVDAERHKLTKTIS